MQGAALLILVSVAACIVVAGSSSQQTKTDTAVVAGGGAPSEASGTQRTLYASKDGRTRLTLHKTSANASSEKPKVSGFRFSHRF